MAPAVLSHGPQPPKPRCTQGWDDLVTLTTAYGHGCLHPPLLQFLSCFLFFLYIIVFFSLFPDLFRSFRSSELMISLLFPFFYIYFHLIRGDSFLKLCSRPSLSLIFISQLRLGHFLLSRHPLRFPLSHILALFLLFSNSFPFLFLLFCSPFLTQHPLHYISHSHSFLPNIPFIHLSILILPANISIFSLSFLSSPPFPHSRAHGQFPPFFSGLSLLLLVFLLSVRPCFSLLALILFA